MTMTADAAAAEPRRSHDVAVRRYVLHSPATLPPEFLARVEADRLRIQSMSALRFHFLRLLRAAAGLLDELALRLDR
jgi:hypothetical protein